jgi:hypothetical protein
LGSERVVGLAGSYNCRLLLEPAPATPSAGLRGARELIDLAGGDKRIGVCFDSCHMFATGFDIRTADKVSEVVDRFAGTVGIRRLKSLHVSDSMTPLGSNRDRHASPEGRDRSSRVRRVPVGAALREAAGPLRGPGHERPRPRQGGRGQDEEAAQERPAGAQATPALMSARPSGSAGAESPPRGR